MKAYTIVAVVLIALGILGLVYGQFSYTEQSESATPGPLELTVNEKQTVNAPVWVGAGSIAGGAGLLISALTRHQPVWTASCLTHAA